MAMNSGYSNIELIGLLSGILKLSAPPTADATDGEAYYLDKNNQGRGIDLNWDWFTDPKAAFEQVKFKEYLSIGLLLNDIPNSDIIAIPSPPDNELALLQTIIDPSPDSQVEGSVPPEDVKENQSLQEATVIKEDGKDTNYRRYFDTTFFLGLNTIKKQQGDQESNLIILGAGLRRQTKVFRADEQLDEAVGFYITTYLPIYGLRLKADGSVALETVPADLSTFQMGLAVARNDGYKGIDNSSDTKLNTYGIQVAAEIPFSAGEETKLGDPKITISLADQRKPESQGVNWNAVNEEKWRPILDELLVVTSIPELAYLKSAPLGPITVRPNVGYSSKSYLFGRKEKLKTSSQEAKQGLAALGNYLRNFGKTNPTSTTQEPAKDPAKQLTSQQSIANFLASNLGLINQKATTVDATKDVAQLFEVKSAEELKNISVWSVLKGLISSFDGFPLYASPISKKEVPAQGDNKEEATSADDTQKTFLGKRIAALSQVVSNQLATELEVESRAYGVQLAAIQEEQNAGQQAGKSFFGLRGYLSDQPLNRKKEKEEPGEKEETANAQQQAAKKYEAYLQLGKWFANETLEDNWFRRLLPTLIEGGGKRQKAPSGNPGLGIYPVSMKLSEGQAATAADFTQEWRVDLISAGVDIAGATPDGLAKTEYFGLGGIELRFSLIVEALKGQSHPTVIGGFGLKADDLWISFAPPQQPPAESDPETETLLAVQRMFAQAEGKEEPTQKAVKPAVNPNFSVSVGYLSPLKSGSKGTYDVQLYDADGVRGGLIWIPIERGAGPLYLESLGVQLRKVEIQKPELTLLLSGGLRLGTFQMDLIGAGASMGLKSPVNWELIIKGLAVEMKAGPAQITGGFMKRQVLDYSQPDHPQSITAYAGFLKVELKAFSILAMGAYGKMSGGGNSLFIYGAFSAGAGQGIGNAVFKITGLALGFGINRRVLIPTVEQVNDFSLVKMVMGPAQTGLLDPSAEDDPNNAPSKILEQMLDDLRVRKGQYFGAIGLRFLLVEMIDCFALAVAQFGAFFELSILGLGRLALPKGGVAIAYIELNLEVDIKPDDGYFLAEALLTNNSWILDESCQITGGFATAFWYSGQHKGDFVVTLGGYHPEFIRPGHYPTVPRLGLNWVLGDTLVIRGGLYFAVTPSAFMAGGFLDAVFRAGPISAQFKAWTNLLMEWKPLLYKFDAGISLKVSVELGLLSVSASVSVDLNIAGPPFHGVAKVDISIATFSITFGEAPEAAPKLINAFAEFGRSFLDQIEEDGKKAKPDDAKPTGKWAIPTDKTPIAGPALHKINLVQGEILNQGNKKKKDSSSKEEAKDDRWLVRGDEVTFSIECSIPASTYGFGSPANAGKPVEDIPAKEWSGRALTLKTPPNLLQGEQESIRAKGEVGIRPMGIKKLEAPLQVAILREHYTNDGLLDHIAHLSKEELEQLPVNWATSGMSAALWDTTPAEAGVPPKQPAAKIIPDCVTGIEKLSASSPQANHVLPELDVTKIWDSLDQHRSPLSKAQASQFTAMATPPDLDANKNSTQPKEEALLKQLNALGFELDLNPQAPQQPFFRKLKTAPLQGSVGSSL